MYRTGNGDIRTGEKEDKDGRAYHSYDLMSVSTKANICTIYQVDLAVECKKEKNRFTSPNN